MVLTNLELLETLRIQKLIIGYLNINSFRNKFEITTETIAYFAIFLISESKPDATFPNAQFKIIGFKIFSGDHNRFDGELMFYLNENTPYILLNNHTIDTMR